MISGKVVYSCTVLAIDAQGKKIQTIEGLAAPGKLHPVSEAFWNNDAQQCGYCTPGFVMAAKGFLDKHPNPTYEEVKKGLGGNLCRCALCRRSQGSARSREEYGRPQCLITTGRRWINGESWASRLSGWMVRQSRVDGEIQFRPQSERSAARDSATCPHAHAKITSIDISPAEKMPGVTAVRAIRKAGDEIHGPARRSHRSPLPMRKRLAMRRARSRSSMKSCRTLFRSRTFRK